MKIAKRSFKIFVLSDDKVRSLDSGTTWKVLSIAMKISKRSFHTFVLVVTNYQSLTNGSSNNRDVAHPIRLKMMNYDSGKSSIL
jgi:hypothetical protein